MLGNQGYFIFSGNTIDKDNSEAIRSYLKDCNIPFKEVVGCYTYKSGQTERENSFVVNQCHEHTVNYLAKRFNQESILYVNPLGNATLEYLDGRIVKLGKFKQVLFDKSIKAATYDPIDDSWWIAS